MDKRELIKNLMNQLAMRYVGTFYSWGGDDPSGFDCSGFVIELLSSVGLVPHGFDATAAGLFDMFETVPDDYGTAGCLVFRRNTAGSIVHIGYMIDDWHVIHSAGGGRHVKTKADAIRHNAFIKVRPVWGGAEYCTPFVRRVT